MTKRSQDMEWFRPSLGGDVAAADLSDKATRSAVYRERGREIHAGRHVDVAKTIGRALEAAYQEGLEAARAGEGREDGRRRGTATITPLTLTPRPRGAMQSIATLTDEGKRAPILRRLESRFSPAKWIMSVAGSSWTQEFGDTTIAQLVRLELLVTVPGHDDVLTLSRRGVAMARDGRVAADHDASPAWTFKAG